MPKEEKSANTLLLLEINTKLDKVLQFHEQAKTRRRIRTFLYGIIIIVFFVLPVYLTYQLFQSYGNLLNFSGNSTQQSGSPTNGINLQGIQDIMKLLSPPQ